MSRTTRVCRLARAAAWPLPFMAMLAIGTRAAGQPALPSGGTVVAGSAAIGAPVGDTLTVAQSSARAILDWSSFSIGQGGTVRIENGAGATLNRVTGASVSSIDGLLSASGSVYLLNPNGVVIGTSGVVDVGGSFVASTLGLGDDAFMAGGDLGFTGSGGAAVINLGRVGALGGDVALIAGRIENRGEITVANGTAGLAAGTDVLLRDAVLDGGKFLVRLGGTGTSATNAGTIRAAAAELRANGGNVYALAGDTGGAIVATGVSAHDGRIWLTTGDGGTAAVAGSLIARGAGGAPGTIETSGSTVAIHATTIDAGAGGAWLLDPTDLMIDQTAAGTIAGSLNAGTNVTQQTSAAGTSGNGDISVGANVAIAWSTGAGLTLSAYRNIALGDGAALTSTGGGAVTLYADNTGTGTGSVTFGTGATVSTAGAVNVYYDGSQNAVVTGGGTLTAYKLVNTAADLQSIGQNGTYALGRDIDLAGVALQPLTHPGGYYNQYGQTIVTPGGFSGTFDGLGHTISNLTLSSTVSGATSADLRFNYGYTSADMPDVGLFDMLTSTGIVRNVKLLGGTVSAILGAGASSISSHIGALVGNNLGTISNVTSTVDVTANGATYAGGLAGISSGTIANSYATGAVTANTGSAPGGYESRYGAYSAVAVENSGYVGGLVGGNSGAITASGATGSVGGAGVVAAGGLVGMSSGTINASYASGAVVATTAPAPSTCSQCYTSNASGIPAYTGGLAGANSGAITQSYAVGAVNGAASVNVGGLVAYNSGSIGGASASGAVTAGSGATGGFVGVNAPASGSAATIVNAYWDQGTTKQTLGIGANSGTVTRLLAVGGSGPNAYAASTYTNFAFGAGGDWVVFDGFTRPLLQTEYATAIATPHQLQLVATNPGARYTLLSDLMLTGTASGADIWSGAGFVPIGTAQAPFTGSLAASGHVLSALSIAQSGTSAAGLFGYTRGATVADLVLTGAAVDGGGYTGVLAGNADTSSFTNISATGSVNATTSGLGFGAARVAGGLVGIATGGTLADSDAAVDVRGSGDAGGLIGSSTAAISRSTATGTVVSYGSGGEGGGLVGYNGGSITDSYATGQVGIFLSFTNYPLAAGLVGRNDGTIATSYASGVVGSFPGYTAGLVGRNNGSVTGSYWDSGTTKQAAATQSGSGPADVTAVGGTSALSPYVAASYAAFDMSGTGAWVIFEGSTRPLLRSEYATAVTNGHQLQLVALSPAAGYTLAGNVALGEIANAAGVWNPATGFVPIGSSATPFSGTFDGKGRIVTALSITRTDSDNVGLFAGNIGTITNLKLDNPAVRGRTNVGAIAGFNTGIVSGVTSGVTFGGTIAGTNSVGGLVGYNLGSVAGTTLASSSAGVVTATNFAGGLVGYNAGTLTGIAASRITGGTYAGGLAGYNDAKASLAGTFSGSVVATNYAGGIAGFSSGAIGGGGTTDAATVSATRGAGGLVGFNTGRIAASSSAAAVSAQDLAGGFVGVNFGTIADQAAAGAVSGGTQLGGFAGANAGAGTLTNVSANGAVSGTGTLGGLVGYNDATIAGSHATGAVSGAGGAAASFAGGLVGYNARTIGGSYATGAVTGNAWTGGLVGYNDTGATIANAGASGRVSGVDYAGGLAGYNGGTIDSANANAAVSASGRGAGGLVGYNTGTLSHAYALGTAAAPTLSGGLVALNFGQVTLSFAAGAVTGGDTAGGLVGYNAGTLAQVYATGAVRGTAAVGGLAGTNDGGVSDAYATGAVTARDAATAGGLVGLADTHGSVARAYAAGAVGAGGGGIAGTNRGSLADTFYDLDGTGAAAAVAAGPADGALAVGGTSGRSAFGQASYPGFDFDRVWIIQQGQSRPYLRANQQSPAPR